MIVTVAICLLITVGVFEAFIFIETHNEEDFYIVAGSFFIAGFLILTQIGGTW